MTRASNSLTHLYKILVIILSCNNLISTRYLTTYLTLANNYLKGDKLCNMVPSRPLLMEYFILNRFNCNYWWNRVMHISQIISLYGIRHILLDRKKYRIIIQGLKVHLMNKCCKCIRIIYAREGFLLTSLLEAEKKNIVSSSIFAVNLFDDRDSTLLTNV